MKISYYYKDEPSEFIENLPDYGKSVTDISSYHPNISNVVNRVESGGTMKPHYAFPDGIDTGERIPFMDLRKMDITEVEQMQKAYDKRVSSQIERGQRAAESAIDELRRDVPIDMTPQATNKE